MWEVERLLNECQELGHMPQILLMENVPAVRGVKSKPETIEDWNMWVKTLEDLGYHNYVSDLKAADFNCAQNRNRCFMISLLSDKLYNFPDSIPLRKRFKDYLDKPVDERFYIKTPKAEKFIADMIAKGELKDLPIDKPLGNLTPADNEKIHQRNFVFNEYGIAPTLTATMYKDSPRVMIDE